VLPQTTTYTFSIDSMRITNTRSLHEDTDYVTASVTIGTGAPQTKTLKIGDVNNGTHPINITFEGITIPENQKAVLTYAIVNSGSTTESDAIKALNNAGTQLANKAAQAAAKAVGSEIAEILGQEFGTVISPGLGSILGAIAGWLVGEVIDILKPGRCNGPVAAGVHAFTLSDLANGASGSDHNPGIDSPDGCGSNSNYYVDWTVRAVRSFMAPTMESQSANAQ
jgi:hypothetical protein